MRRRFPVTPFLLLVVIIALSVAADRAARWWNASGPLTEARTLVVQKGGVRSIARQLANAGIIDQRFLFELGAKASGEGPEFKAGEYLFAPGISPADTAELLVSGRTIVHRLVIPEGFTTSEALAAIDGAPAMSGRVFAPPAEGALLPDTYFYKYGDDRQLLVERMVRAMSLTLTSLWANRAPGLPVHSPREALILASIIEKETALPMERPEIAQVFDNRLAKGMRLQSDPTVIYALTQGRGALRRSLTHADMQTASPYNTYVIAGLPPTPIANPGKASLKAALHPSGGDALYFVADGSGGHVFSDSLAAHNKNVAHWRQHQAGAK